MAFNTPEETLAYAKGRADERKQVLAAMPGTSAHTVMSNAQIMSSAVPSDPRFRSFAERFVVERASTFRTDEISKDTWQCIMDAKRAYKMIEAVGRNITEENTQ